MDSQYTETTQKLLHAFMQFSKAEWHQRSIMGYKPSEIRVLFCIRNSARGGMPEMKVSEISKRLHITSPSVTQVMKTLEAQGLVERKIDPADRRAVGITLTEKGELVTQKAGEEFVRSLQGLIDYLGEEQSEQLAELLLKVFTYFHEKDATMRHTSWSGDDFIC